MTAAYWLHVSDLEKAATASIDTTQPNDRAVLEVDNAPPTLTATKNKKNSPYNWEAHLMDYLGRSSGTSNYIRSRQMGKLSVIEINPKLVTPQTLQSSLVLSGAIATDSYLATVDVADIMDLPLTKSKGAIRYLSTPVKEFLELLRQYSPSIFDRTITVLQTITVAPNKPEEEELWDRPDPENGRRGWWHRRVNRRLKEKLRRRTKMRYWRTYR